MDCWPPKYDEPSSAPPGAEPPPRFPPEGFPTKAQIEYVTSLIALGLLLLMLPWIVGKALTDPQGLVPGSLAPKL